MTEHLPVLAVGRIGLGPALPQPPKGGDHRRHAYPRAQEKDLGAGVRRGAQAIGEGEIASDGHPHDCARLEVRVQVFRHPPGLAHWRDKNAQSEE